MEFGSDFHNIDYPKRSIGQFVRSNYNLYTSGRQALVDLATARNWQRLWIPSYFCEESLHCLKRIDIELCHYHCLPFDNPEDVVSNLKAKANDGILVVNYFGIHGFMEFNSKAEIVEDHTHNLIGDWSLNSKADWCIASLRKTLPIPDGGILWSPKGLNLPTRLHTTQETEDIMSVRYRAMVNKAKYLAGQPINKVDFLSDFCKTEEAFDGLSLSGISTYSSKILSDIDIEHWYSKKYMNFNILRELVKLPKDIRLFEPLNLNDVPFSFCLQFNNKTDRDVVRNQLIKRSVYPAILWNIESDRDLDAKSFGNRILSIHCDGRYSELDMQLLSEILNTVVQNSCKS